MTESSQQDIPPAPGPSASASSTLSTPSTPSTSKTRLRDDLLILLGFFAALALLGRVYLALPPHWDALGYVYPSAIEIREHMRTPFLVATADAGHPTLLYWLLGAVWRVQRLAGLPGGPHWPAHLLILFFSAATLLFTYRLAREVLGRFESAVASVLLMLHPVFFAQSLQVHLDHLMMASVAATTYFFWRRRWALFALAASVMVLSKAYGALYLLVFVLWTYVMSYRRPYRERGRFVLRRAVLYLSPATLFLVFIVLRGRCTGFLLTGSGHMSDVNLTPVRNVPEYFARMGRVFQEMFVGHGAMIFLLAALAGWAVEIAVALRASRDGGKWGALNPIAGRSGRFFLLLALQLPLNVLLWSLRPESIHRYFLPAYPCIFVLGTAGLARILGSSRVRFALVAAAVAILFVFRWNPAWSQVLPGGWLQSFFSYNRGEAYERLNVSDETTLAFADYVRCIQDAADWLSANRPDSRIVTHYPINSALTRPGCGYVLRPLRVEGESVDDIENVRPGMADTYVFSSINVTRLNPVVLGRYFEVQRLKRFEHGRHFVEIYGIGPLRKPGE